MQTYDLEIDVSGGMVVAVRIDGKPVGADVRDFDIQGADPADLHHDDNGEAFIRYSP